MEQSADISRIQELVESMLQDAKDGVGHRKRDVERLRFVLWLPDIKPPVRKYSGSVLIDHIIELMEFWKSKFDITIESELMDICLLLCIYFQLLDTILFRLLQYIVDGKLSGRVQVWSKIMEDLLNVESNTKCLSLFFMGRGLKASEKNIIEVLTRNNFVDKVGNLDTIKEDFAWHLLVKELVTLLGSRRSLSHFKGSFFCNWFNVKHVFINENPLLKGNKLVFSLNDRILYVWVKNNLTCLIDLRSQFQIKQCKTDNIVLQYRSPEYPVIFMGSYRANKTEAIKLTTITLEVDPIDLERVMGLISTLTNKRKISVTVNPIVVTNDENYTCLSKECPTNASLNEIGYQDSKASARIGNLQTGNVLAKATSQWSTSSSPSSISLTQGNSFLNRVSIEENISESESSSPLVHNVVRKAVPRIVSSSFDQLTFCKSPCKFHSFIPLMNISQVGQKQTSTPFRKEDFHGPSMTTPRNLHHEIGSTQVPDSDVYATDFAPMSCRIPYLTATKCHNCTEIIRNARPGNRCKCHNFETSTECGVSDANNTSGIDGFNGTSFIKRTSPLTSVASNTFSQDIVHSCQYKRHKMDLPEEQLRTGVDIISRSFELFTEEIVARMRGLRNTIADAENEVALVHKQMQLLQFYGNK